MEALKGTCRGTGETHGGAQWRQGCCGGCTRDGTREELARASEISEERMAGETVEALKEAHAAELERLTAELSGDKDAAADALATAHKGNLLVSKPRSLREGCSYSEAVEALKEAHAAELEEYSGLGGDKDAAADALATAHKEELARVEAEISERKDAAHSGPWRH